MAYWVYRRKDNNLSKIHEVGEFHYPEGFETCEDAEQWASLCPDFYYVTNHQHLQPPPPEDKGVVEYGVVGNFSKALYNGFKTLDEAKEYIEGQKMVAEFHIQPFNRVGNPIYPEKVEVVEWIEAVPEVK